MHTDNVRIMLYFDDSSTRAYQFINFLDEYNRLTDIVLIGIGIEKLFNKQAEYNLDDSMLDGILSLNSRLSKIILGLKMKN